MRVRHPFNPFQKSVDSFHKALAYLGRARRAAEQQGQLETIKAATEPLRKQIVRAEQLARAQRAQEG
ncbi:MAG: hypothetical protein M1546_21050 [Chloroflexi bacterium]|nr:hypothetical protein [Chloroflexota bacterium]